MNCTNCNTIISNKMKYCPECAQPIELQTVNNQANQMNKSNNIQMRDIKGSKNISIEQNIYSANNIEAEVYYDVVRQYGTYSKIKRDTLLSIIPTGLGTIYYLFDSIKTVMNIGEVLRNGVGNPISTSIMMTIMIIFMFQILLLVHLKELKDSSFVSLFRNSIFQLGSILRK